MGLGWVRVGAKCVWVESGDRGVGALRNPHPSKGDICLISGIIEDCWGHGLALIIKGYPNHGKDGKDYGWNVSRFRPLLTKTLEQDMEAFNHLLNPTPLERLDRLAELLDIR